MSSFLLKFTDHIERSNADYYRQRVIVSDLKTALTCLTELVNPAVWPFTRHTEIDHKFSVAECYAGYQGNLAYVRTVCVRLSFLLSYTRAWEQCYSHDHVVLQMLLVLTFNYCVTYSHSLEFLYVMPSWHLVRSNMKR